MRKRLIISSFLFKLIDMAEYKKLNYVVDCETMADLFMICAEEYKDEKINYTFVIHHLRNDYNALIEFLEHNITYDEYHIGFNNIAFDSQVIEYILNNKLKHLEMDPDEIAKDIYEEAQAVIES